MCVRRFRFVLFELGTSHGQTPDVNADADTGVNAAEAEQTLVSQLFRARHAYHIIFICLGPWVGMTRIATLPTELREPYVMYPLFPPLNKLGNVLERRRRHATLRWALPFF